MKRTHFALILGMVFLFGARAGVIDPLKSTISATPVRVGVALLLRGDLDGAEAKFREALRTNRGRASAMVGLADIAVKRQQPGIAAKFLKDAMALEPDSVAIQRSFAAYLITQNRLLEAEDVYKRALQKNFDTAAVYKELGDLYLIHLDRRSDAIASFERAVAAQPEDAEIHKALGTALVTRDLVRSEKEFRTAARLAPRDASPMYSLGLALAEQRQYDRALEAFNSALQVEPGMAAALLARGDVYLFKGDFIHAEADYSASRAAAPNDPSPLARLGDLYSSRKQFGSAVTSYQAALRLNPNLSSTHNNLAYLLLLRNSDGQVRKQELDEALRSAETAVRLAPKTLEFQDTLAWVYRSRGEYAKAAEILQRLRTLNPTDPSVLYHLGVVYQHLGKSQEAARSLEAALAIKSPFDGSDDAVKRLGQLRHF